MYIKNKLNPNTFQIPGLVKAPFFKRKLGWDVLFFLAVFALPTNFFNFLPSNLFVDTRLLYLIVGLLYIAFNIKNYLYLIRVPGAKLLVLVVVFLVFRILYSYAINYISIVEIVTIFRTNFSYPIITFGFLLYAVKMDNARLYRFLYWIFVVSLITSVIYIISNLTGISPYANQAKDYQTFDNTVIVQNLAAISRYNPFLYLFAIFAVLTQPDFKKTYYIYVPLLVVILSNVRSQLLVFLILLGLCFVLITKSDFQLKKTKFVKFFIVGVFTLFIGSVIFQAHINRLIDKFGIQNVEQVNTDKYLKEGTYKVRLDLIEEAHERIVNNSILGNGYIREARKGQYDFVVGTDTFIAPVLYTEGYLGFFIRLLPLLFFSRLGLIRLKSTNKITVFTAVTILSLILANAVNIVQTRIFINYNEYIFMFFLLMFFNHNNLKNQVLTTNEIP